jgi:hypothetical protein
MAKGKNFLTDFPDIEHNYSELLNKYFTNFRRILMNSKNMRNYVLNPEHFSCITHGSSVLSPLSGNEPYGNMPDVVAFFMNLALASPKKIERVAKLYGKIQELLQYVDIYDSVYSSLITAIDMYRPETIDTNLMLTIAGGCGYRQESHCNAKVFTDHVTISSLGQLLNHSLSKQFRTEILWAEIEKGLRDDKLTGIPPEEIISFFEDQPDKIIIKAFDINMIAINSYFALQNVGNLDAFVEKQIKNINFQYQFTSTAEQAPPQIPQLPPEEITKRIKDHYLNLQKIFDRIIRLGTQVKDYTFGYLITHAPPENFLLDSSYMKLCSVFGQIANGDYTPGDAVDGWLTQVKHIVLLNPSINIPHDVMLDLALTPEELSIMTDGLELGLARYALFYLGGCNILAYRECDTEIGKADAEAFLDKTFPEKLSYIFNEVEEAEIQETVDLAVWKEEKASHEKGVNFAELLHSEYNFKYYDLKQVFKRTQEYVDCLGEMLAADLAFSREEVREI